MTDQQVAALVSDDLKPLFEKWVKLGGTVAQIGGCVTGSGIAMAQFAGVSRDDMLKMVNLAYGVRS